MSISRHGAKLCSLGLVVVLAACGDGGSSPEPVANRPSNATPSNPATPAAGDNAAPTITGTPPAAALADAQYVFKPDAADPDGDVVTFRIRQKPGWATFSEATGELNGTPRASDVGMHEGIVISATDGAAETSLDAFSITVNQTGSGSATLTWLPPTENTDGTPLTDLAGYKIYWGTSPGVYSSSIDVDNAGLAAYQIDNLLPARYYFVATAYNTAGIESDTSNVAEGEVL